jgi:hypothetical protein
LRVLQGLFWVFVDYFLLFRDFVVGGEYAVLDCHGAKGRLAMTVGAVVAGAG